MQISVIGTSEEANKQAIKDAYLVGQELAGREIITVCGGLTGVMKEVSRGAFEAGGDVLAVLPTSDPSDANPWVTHVVATGISHARNLAVVASGDAAIAIGGHWGTLSEISFARKLGLTVICLGQWEIRFPGDEVPGLLYAKSPEEAVEMAAQNAIVRVRTEEGAESVDDLLDS